MTGTMQKRTDQFHCCNFSSCRLAGDLRCTGHAPVVVYRSGGVGAQDARRSRVQRVFSRGATVVEQGTSWPYVGLVASGSVTIARTDAGRDYCLYEAFPSDVFGEIQGLDTGVTIARYDAGAAKA